MALAMPKSKAKAYLKKVLPVDTPEPELLPPDPLSAIVFDVEKLSNAQSALSALEQSTLEIGLKKFFLGGVLKKVHDEGWTCGFGSSKDLYAHFGMKVRQAQYLMSSYEWVHQIGLNYDDVKEIKWSKVRLLARSKKAAEDPHTWVENAKKLSYLALKAALKPKLSSPSTETKIFKLHPDQKEVVYAALKKAKAELGTDVDTVALEHICIAHGSGAVASKTAKARADLIPISQRKEVARELLEKLSLEDRMAVVQAVCPNYAA